MTDISVHGTCQRFAEAAASVRDLAAFDHAIDRLEADHDAHRQAIEDCRARIDETLAWAASQ